MNERSTFWSVREFLIRPLPLFAVEIVARIFGWLVGIYRPGWSFATERLIRGLYWGLRFGSRTVRIGRNVQLETADRMDVGDNVTLFCGSHYVCGSTGHIKIGSFTHIGRHCTISGLGEVVIGERCLISSNIAIYSVSNDPYSTQPISRPNIKKAVKIGDDVLVGAGCVFLPGAQVGSGTTIAAGSVVSGKIGSKIIAGGSPAKLLREKDHSDE